MNRNTVGVRRTAALLMMGAFATASSAAPLCKPLGELDAFWRYSPALGPFHEVGQALIEIPDYVLKSDFPYAKKPYPREVPFADHLSMVRILGGFNDGSEEGEGDPAVRARDLARRDERGDIRYRMELLEPRLRPYLDCGYSSFTIVLDNVPWCFPEDPNAVGLGQYEPPRDPKEWHDFIVVFCRELERILGAEKANQLRFRVGTENNGLERFGGTHEEFVRHYDAAAVAVKTVLPGADFGPYNISGANLRHFPKQNVNALALAEHCRTEPNTFNGARGTPFDWVAFSRYYSPDTDVHASARGCYQIWEEFERRFPSLEFSREIHEFDVAPFGEERRGAFVSEEYGALGAALTAQMTLRLREAGIDRLFHWEMADRFRDRRARMKHLFTGHAWLLSVLERGVGGESYLLEPLFSSMHRTDHLGFLSVGDDWALFVFAAYNRKTDVDEMEEVVFQVPAEVADLRGMRRSTVVLDRETAVHDRIRDDLAAAGLLVDRFVERPDRLGGVREMGKGRPAEGLVGDKLETYHQQWIDSLTLQPLEGEAGSIRRTLEGYTLALNLAPPEVRVIWMER
ncbi:hypothetical protein [Kiritimatiella glycovorans]|uniref:Putative glycosyl hydrolase n=1 Tax=Kiritimatiella glycovorans TaxID=1307763 RepID=A0A0G3EK16_9BACT|nr:hypothetical protein [Kiritimatiella glycovorans]AKJ64479.1 putative glycosyl hydrolase [Kiritimatiella glycovorans]